MTLEERTNEMKLHQLTDKEISQLQHDLKLEIDRRSQEKRKEALLAARATAEKYGFTLEELLPTPKQRNAPKAKYQNPEDPAKTWTGLGRQPKWLVAALELGHTLDEMRIQ